MHERFVSPSSQGPIVQKQQDKGETYEHRLGEKPQAKRDNQWKIRCEIRSSRIAQICRHAKAPEQAGEHVFALGNPGYRFHMERMEGEQGGNQEARPHATRCVAHHPKEQQRVRRM